MKAAVIRGAHDLSVIEMPDPAPGPGEVVLSVDYVGICGSDLSYYSKGAIGAFQIRQPLVPGHEIVGRVVRDDRPNRLKPGTPVTIHPASPGSCLPGLEARPNIWPGSRYLGSAMTMPHQQGGMSTLLAIGADHLRVLPESLPLRRAALAEPLAVGLHAISLAGSLTNRRVLVSGAGPIGVLLALACQIEGAEVTITDILPEAIERARRIGIATGQLVDRQPVTEETYDIVFEASGSPRALSDCLRSLVRGGQMIQVGLLPSGDQPVDVSALATRELRYIGSFRFNDEIDLAIRLLTDHPQFEGVVTHEFALGDIETAFACAGDPATSLKVLIALNATPSLDEESTASML